MGINCSMQNTSDVISIALAPEKQDHQNVAKLRGLNPGSWRRLVDLIHRERNGASLDKIGEILNLKLPNQEAEAIAARSNVSTIVGLLHDPSSQTLVRLLEALAEGKLCVVDTSQMRGQQGFVLAGIILRQIFTRNQEEFTKQSPKTIPTIAVIEEAQSVLNERAASAEPFVSWVKEGRKYDLGAVLITQQPGSIPNEILSQGDNWFIFHLLSAADLQTLRSANAHFSSDLLGSLLNEPIRGQGVFWSSAASREYPIPVRIHSFETEFKMLDPSYNRPAVTTFATMLRERTSNLANAAQAMGATTEPAHAEDDPEPLDFELVPDITATKEQIAIAALRDNAKLVEKINTDGEKWGTIQFELAKAFKGMSADPFKFAFDFVLPALNAVFGPQNTGWRTETLPDRKKLVKAIKK
jgi:hypothetical protein